MELGDWYFKGVNLSRTDLQETKFTHTNLSGCNFGEAKILETRFICANLTDTDFRNAKIILDVSFTEANLTRANFFGVDSREILKAISDDAYFQDTIMPNGTILSSD
ncbi:pentapeptide repeat-containing protein [Iningainema tapete]|uniref:Pentapeptide repeat-containing protein n=1 Tax=Iningainema tapete BLCC-T55 TaxID=2748662 RepID=A0A8J6XRF6_9CYAN|nr:pentapeptide repeat-containing protein [Iningainema tapete]MBD2777851.1 pentapeptide repeat-containing protein [Iningainema tapete BLCC-T55]